MNTRILQNTPMSLSDIAHTAARLMVEEGLDYGSAKTKAVKQLGLPARHPLPDNDSIEAEVRSYIELYCHDTQPAELLVLRRLALQVMEKLSPLRPHVSGPVWHGTATRHSDIYLQLFCEEAKEAEIFLLNLGLPYEPGQTRGFHGKTVEALTLSLSSTELQTQVLIHLLIYDHDDLRGALKPDTQGRPPRGDARALAQLIPPLEAP